MSFQLVFYTEATATDVAGVRFLARVLGNVHHQRRPCAEGLLAVAALEWEHVRVCAIVHEERGFLLERLAAYVTDVWSLAGVDTPVILRIAPRREHATAQIARYVLDAGMGLFQVPRQALIDTKSLATHVASEQSFARVDAYVPVESVRRVQVFPAFAAVIIHLAVVLHPGAHHGLRIHKRFPIFPCKLGVHFRQMDIQQFLLLRDVLAMSARISSRRPFSQRLS